MLQGAAPASGARDRRSRRGPGGDGGQLGLAELAGDADSRPCSWAARSATSSTASGFGYVVDFADIGIGTWRFYIFNIADSAVTVAILLMLALWFLGPGLGRHAGTQREGDRPARWGRAGLGKRPGGLMRRLTITVPETAAGRVDRFVADVSGLSRSYVQKLITEGHVTTGGLPLKANESVVPGRGRRAGGTRSAAARAGSRADPAVGRLRGRRHADRRQGGRAGRPSLRRATRAGRWSTPCWPADTEYGGIAGVQRPGHRPPAGPRHERPADGRQERPGPGQPHGVSSRRAASRRRTWVWSQGAVAATTGRIEAPIGRDPHHRTRMAVVPDGRAAVTGYRVRERLPGWTLLELDLITGRTHQIRVHLAAIGHPLAGDPMYGTGTSRRGPAGLGPALPAQLADRAAVAERRPPHPRRGAAARRARGGAGGTASSGERRVRRSAERARLPDEERGGESEAYQREAAGPPGGATDEAAAARDEARRGRPATRCS